MAIFVNLRPIKLHLANPALISESKVAKSGKEMGVAMTTCLECRVWMMAQEPMEADAGNEDRREGHDESPVKEEEGCDDES